MKITCDCNNIIYDSTDCLKHKGHLISDTQWDYFWEAIDKAIETTKDNEKENACMQLRTLNLFKQLWECNHCGKLYTNNTNGSLISYSPDNNKYNKVLDKK